jgi:hypothetical protein
MPDDSRIKRILKRYQKNGTFSDGIMDVTSLGVDELLQACRCAEVSSLDAPKELDDQALAHLARRMGIEFDRSQFDYFLHSYVRAEFCPADYNDPWLHRSQHQKTGHHKRFRYQKGCVGFLCARKTDRRIMKHMRLMNHSTRSNNQRMELTGARRDVRMLA